MTADAAANPLLRWNGLPAFGEIHAEHVVPAVRQTLASLEQTLTSLEAAVPADWEGLMRPLTQMSVALEQVWGPIRHLMGVQNTPALRTAYETVQPEIVRFGLRLDQSQPLYRGMRALADAGETLTPTQQRILTQRLRDAELSGIGLQGAERERFNAIAESLSVLQTTFTNHVLDATRAFAQDLDQAEQVAGLPPSARGLMAQSWNQAHPEATQAATADAGPWRVTLDAPVYLPILEYAQDRSLRETVYRAYIQRASSGDLDNTPLLSQILVLRREQAQLLGYDNFAELSLTSKMATVPDVLALLETLRTASWEQGVAELEELREIARAHGQTEPLSVWDVAFWRRALRETRFSFTAEDLRPYFPMPRVLDGLFALCNRLFGVRILADDAAAARWHDDVRYFRVQNSAGQDIAGFYLDPYSRPQDKRGGAWMGVCVARRLDGQQVVNPIAYLVCNATPAVGDQPALMTFDEVETLFHEFGHGLQHMLTTVDEYDAAGIAGVEWDAVELPSQFMENWCYHRETLLGMTAHVDTGVPLPEDLYERICQSRTFGAASMMLRQLLFGLTDMHLHLSWTPDSSQSPFDVMHQIAATTNPLPLLAEDRFLCGFSHIFAGGYSAGYYSYKWAEVLSADAFAAFEEVGLDDAMAVQEIGHRFRDTILAQGGSVHPMELFIAFRGRRPTPDALLRHNGLVRAA